ncbi:hypothetical protein LINPERHAP2_LOCUS11337 [Linum perenne]
MSYRAVASSGGGNWLVDDAVGFLPTQPTPMRDDTILNPMCPKISFSEDEVRSFYKPWSKALVVKVLERNFSYQTVKRRLETLWARSGKIQDTDAANAFYLARFSDQDDYQRATFKGPWKIYDYYISVACLTPQFNEEEPLKKILTWVRLPRLPIHFFNELAVDSEIVATPEKILPETPKGDAGSWMTVCRWNKGKSKVEKPIARPAKYSRSRFTILQREDVTLTSQTSEKPTPEAAKIDDPTTIKHVAELAAVLKAASAEPKKGKSAKAPAKPKTSVRDPLSDISNATKTNQQAQCAGQANNTSVEAASSENLVQVPVTYVNPIFQGADLGSDIKKMTKAKTKKGISSSTSRWSDPGKTAAKKDGRPIRNFTSRPTKETSSIEGKKGDPPDTI